MKISDKSNLKCEICIQGKTYKNTLPDKWVTKMIDLLHCHLAGPTKPRSLNGFKYTLCFVDDYFSLIIVYFLKQKSDRFLATKNYLTNIAPYGYIKCLRGDNGTEFTSKI